MQNWLLRSWDKITPGCIGKQRSRSSNITGQICMGSIGRMGGPANN